VQLPALKAIIKGNSPVLVVMPTGAGKSLMFMLPTFCIETGVTVVVPLISLRQDLMRRCKKLGISCAEWDRHRPPDGARLVLVTAESAVKQFFQKFLDRLKLTGQLDRMVIDESTGRGITGRIWMISGSC